MVQDESEVVAGSDVFRVFSTQWETNEGFKQGVPSFALKKIFFP